MFPTFQKRGKFDPFVMELAVAEVGVLSFPECIFANGPQRIPRRGRVVVGDHGTFQTALQENFQMFRAVTMHVGAAQHLRAILPVDPGKRSAVTIGFHLFFL